MHVTVIAPGLYTYGAMVIAGIVRAAGLPVTLRTDLAAGNRDCVLLSLYSTQSLLDRHLREWIQEHRARGGTCYIGGPVSACPEMVLAELKPDAVVVGEAEETILPLLRDGVHPGLPGVAFLLDGKMLLTPAAPPATIEHPLPLIPKDIGAQSIRGASAYLETHRGCTGGCTFCQVPRFFGRTIRSRNLDAIRTEVEAFRAAGATRLSISGGTGSLYNSPDGTIDETAFTALLRTLAEVMGPKNVSAPDIRVDCISDQVLDAIREYTIGWVFFGVESGSDRVLRAMGKGVRIAAVEEAVAACRKHRLHVAGSLIVGYPTETSEDFTQTMQFIERACLDDVFISIAEPIPGTPLAPLAVRTPPEENPLYIPHEGEYRSLHLTEAEARCFDLMLQADLYKPGLHPVTDQIYSTYLAEARRQGREIRAVTDLLRRYARCL